MENTIVVNGVNYYPEKASDPRPYVVIRATSAGAAARNAARAAQIEKLIEMIREGE